MHVKCKTYFNYHGIDNMVQSLSGLSKESLTTHVLYRDTQPGGFNAMLHASMYQNRHPSFPWYLEFLQEFVLSDFCNHPCKLSQTCTCIQISLSEQSLFQEWYVYIYILCKIYWNSIKMDSHRLELKLWIYIYIYILHYF